MLNTVVYLPLIKEKISSHLLEDWASLKALTFCCRHGRKLEKKAPKLIVCGTGPLEDWCISFVTENKCNMEFKGFVPNEEAKKLIAKK